MCLSISNSGGKKPPDGSILLFGRHFYLFDLLLILCIAYGMVMKQIIRSVKRIYSFYRDGFRFMVRGRVLWGIVLVKVFFLFAVLKPFFFPNYLNTQFENDERRAEHVLEQLVGNRSPHPAMLQPGR